jgi:predicted DCC family thiol-disulfide oxidoreductase YuxK
MPRPAVLLYDDECGVCRAIANWVQRSLADGSAGEGPGLTLQPIGEDPEALKRLSPQLDIWEAYATIHLLMPDGSLLRGGEAVAEVLRRLPVTRGLARSFAFSLFGWRPFQALLNGGYTVLAAVRPVFGCESCGQPPLLLRPLAWLVKRAKGWTASGRAAKPPAIAPRAAPRTSPRTSNFTRLQPLPRLAVTRLPAQPAPAVADPQDVRH